MYKPYPVKLAEFVSPNSVEQAISGLWRIDEIILNTTDINLLSEKIVNVMLEELGYLKLGYVIIVLSLLDENQKQLKRISISQTQFAKEALQKSPVPFEQIIFKIEDNENLAVKSILENVPYITDDLSDMLYPAVDRETVRTVQKSLGVVTSLVFPVFASGKPLGTIIFSLNKKEEEISNFEKQILIGFTNATGIAIEHALLLKQLKELDQRKNEFLNMATHELRAPMAAIKGYLSMIIEGDTGIIPEKTRGYLTDATAVTERLIRLVGNMLNVARIEENRLVYQIETVNLSEVSRTVFAEFKGEAVRKNLKFDLIMPPEVKDKVIVDPDRIHEVVANLLSNAIKYTDQGTVTVTLSQPDAEHVRLDVKDTGPGISLEEQKKLFQKFARAESVIGKTVGTGLGLYICKLLVEKFNGKIGLISDVGQGSDFWFELPLAEFAPPIEISQSSDAKPAEKTTV